MAHRLIGSMRRADRMLKNGLFTGNLNNLAQVWPRHSELRQSLSESSVYFSTEPPKTFEKSLCPNSANNDGGAKTVAKETASLDKSAPKAPNKGSKLGGNGGEGGDRTNNSRGSFMDKENISQKVFFVGFIIYGIWTVVDFWRTMQREKIYEEITWKDFTDNFLAQGRVAKVEVTDTSCLRVHTAPGAAADDAKNFQLRLDSLDSHEIVSSVDKTMEMKAELKNEAPVADKNNVQPGRDLPVVD